MAKGWMKDVEQEYGMSAYEVIKIAYEQAHHSKETMKSLAEDLGCSVQVLRYHMRLIGINKWPRFNDHPNIKNGAIKASKARALHKAVIGGEEKSIAEWCRFYGVTDNRTAYKRIKSGWDSEKAVKTPTIKRV